MKKTPIVLTVLAWIVFGFLVFLSVYWVMNYFIAGLLILLAAVLILPPLGELLKRYRIQGWMRGVACLVLAAVGLYIAGAHLQAVQTADTQPAAVGGSAFASVENSASAASSGPLPVQSEIPSEPPMAGYPCAGKIEFDSFDVKEALISFTVSEDYTQIGDITVTLKGLSTLYSTTTGKSKIEMEETSVTYNGSNPADMEDFAIPLGSDGMLFGTIDEQGSFSGSIDYTYTNANPSFSLLLGRGDWVASLPETAPRYQFKQESSTPVNTSSADKSSKVGEIGETSSAAKGSSAAEKKALDYPATGILTDNTSGSGFGILKINTASGNPTYIKIYSASGGLVKTLFIHGGDSIQTDLDQGSYIVKYATGENWYGEKEMFGSSGIYQKADTVLEYAESGAGYELTLKSVVNGNLGSVGQSKNTF